MAEREQVERFLKELREKIRFFDIAFRPRDKNLDALSEHEIIPIKRIEYINKLTADDYYRGPSKDTYDPSRPDYYEFGTLINGVEFYIKISLGLPGKRVDCMSFHEAEFPIEYPLKTKNI